MIDDGDKAGEERVTPELVAESLGVSQSYAMKFLQSPLAAVRDAAAAGGAARMVPDD